MMSRRFGGLSLTAGSGRLVIIAALAAGVLLAGCGRKGSLEPPPSASISAPPASGQPTLGEPEHDALAGERRTVTAGQPSSQKKSFPLDFLITGPEEEAHARAREERAKAEAAAAAAAARR
jgi:predicted small lipoprotein YifL